jgi:hypothetical protein
MKKLMQKIHLYTGLGLLAFVLMYFFSGFVLVQHNLFPNGDTEKLTRVEQVRIPAALNVEKTGEWIASQFSLNGQPLPAQKLEDGRVRYRFGRPGTNLTAVLDADKRNVEIETTRWDFRRLMVGYHRIHGYRGNMVWLLWALMYDLASAGCILFAVSGVWIWATARERDKVSWVMLAVGVGFTLTMVLYLMLMP